MTRQRSFKRLVRSRMEKTGESYTAARATLLFCTQGGDEGQVALLHERHPDAAEAERMKAFWGARVSALKQHLEG